MSRVSLRKLGLAAGYPLAAAGHIGRLKEGAPAARGHMAPAVLGRDRDTQHGGQLIQAATLVQA